MSEVSKFLRHTSCPHCGSSDGLAVYSDGHTYCFVCNTHSKGDGTITTLEKEAESAPLTQLRKGAFTGIPKRHISAQTTEVYSVFMDGDSVVYPLFNVENVHVGNKKRFPEKQFSVEGQVSKAGLFGRQAFPPGSSKAITITEGQDDAMAVYEMFGRKYPAVSVHSASSAVNDVKRDFEYLNSFEKIYVCFDNDSGKTSNVGQEAAKAVADLLPMGKVHIVTLKEHKDANDYLVKGDTQRFVSEWWKAPAYTPEGLRLGPSLWDEVKESKFKESVAYPYSTLNKMTYGLRLSELVVVTADTGTGKTSFIKEIEHFVLNNTKPEYGVGFMHLEESTSDTCVGLMSITANKPLHLPDTRKDVSPEELREYFDKTINSDRIVIWDHFGSNTIESVLAKIRHMYVLGCRYIVLDHLSILVSGSDNDDRKALDQISTQLKTLCMELDICLIAVIQQNRSGQIRGSAGVEHIANIIIKLSRNKTDPDPWRRNVTELLIEKNRFCGRTGPAGALYYDPETGRLVELSDEELNTYNSGGSVGETWA